MTKKSLQAKLTELGIDFKPRATKTELEALLADATPKKTTRPSTKEVIRGMFPKVGATVSRDALFEALSHVKPETVTTMIGDLRNEMYAGRKGSIDIERQGEEYTRVH